MSGPDDRRHTLDRILSAELALVTLERQVLAAAGIADYLKRVDTLRKLLAAEDADTIRGLVLAMKAPTVEAQALAAVLDAFAAGAHDSLDILDTLDHEPISRIGRPSKEAKGSVRGLDKAGTKALATAQKLARAGADSAAITAPLIAHATAVKRSVIGGVNMGGNEGATAIADAAGMSTVWVAETNACVRCLAYSGRVAKAGESFPGGLTYGRRKYADNGPLPHPPLHGFCRCTVELLRSKDYAAALRREADRSVLRGFSLESESMSTRVDAAERLVKHKNLDAPKSVIAYAKSAVKRGKFTTRGR